MEMRDRLLAGGNFVPVIFKSQDRAVAALAAAHRGKRTLPSPSA